MILILLAAALPAPAATDSPPRPSVRSVYLNYPGAESAAFYNEVTVDRSAPGSFFCVEGFNAGYFGIQELGNGKKVVIFSVWDEHRGNNRNAVPDDMRVKILNQGPGVRADRFGGEGTGAHAFLDVDWKVGTTYRFLLTARPDGQRTAYTARFFTPETGKWQPIATFSTFHHGQLLRGYYSFIEDFRRSKETIAVAHEAQYGNGWIRGKDGKWSALATARFTADSQKLMNIDAGLRGGKFFLVTGGDTQNRTTKLNQRMTRPQAPLPTDLDAVLLRPAGN